MYEIPDPSREEAVLQRMREISKELYYNKAMPDGDDEQDPPFVMTRKKVGRFAVNVEAQRQRYAIERVSKPDLIALAITTLKETEAKYSIIYRVKHSPEIDKGGAILHTVMEEIRNGTT